MKLTLLLTDLPHNWIDSEMVLVGDLDWDWLSSFVTILIVVQLISLPTRLNQKDLDKSTLLDLILTNSLHRLSAVGTFCNDVSDHCAVVCVRNCKIPKSKPRFIYKRQF